MNQAGPPFCGMKYRDVLHIPRFHLGLTMLTRSRRWISNEAAILKISTQFPECPEGKLCLAIIKTAIHDRDSRFLSGDMWPAQLCGVDPDWIRLVLRRLS